MIQHLLHDLWLRHKQAQRFKAHLGESLERAARWRSVDDALAEGRSALDALAARPLRARVKGEPPVSELKRKWAQELRAALGRGEAPELGAEALAQAALMSSVAPADLEAYRAYLAIYWLVHQEVIRGLQAQVSQRFVALHMTCLPRLARAEESAASFTAHDADRQLAHLFLVGGAERCAFEPASGLLQVGAPDSYEHLPRKVFAAYELLAVSLGSVAILKVDDDHRLKSFSQLMRRLRGAAAAGSPRQEGSLYEMSMPSAHLRGWHFGKCQDPDLNEKTITQPSPPAWITGEHGYLLNAAALRACAWANLHYASWLHSIAYEDIAVGDVSDRLGVRLVHHPLVGTSLEANAAY